MYAYANDEILNFPLAIGPQMPAPSDHTTDKDLVWKDQKTITLKQKGTTWPYDTRSKSHYNTIYMPVHKQAISFLSPEYAEVTCSPGSGHYYRKDGDTGAGTKRAVSARHREGLHVGYPNGMIQPVDTLGT